MGFFVVLLTSGISTAADGDKEILRKVIAAIQQIRSFDVTYEVKQLGFTNSENVNVEPFSEAISIETNRDLYLFGVGRRIERNVDVTQVHQIAVIDWFTATNNNRALSKAFSLQLPGATYLDHLDPNASGFFLSELLQDPRTEITPLTNKLPAELVAFQITNPKFTGSVHVWADPQRSFRPFRVDWYRRSNGKLVLLNRNEVKDYLKLEPNLWVPLNASALTFITEGSAAGRPISGFTVHVDKDRSSWNENVDRSLFALKQGPNIYENPAGWKESMPTQFIAFRKKADQTAAALTNKWATQHQSISSRFRLTLIIGSLILIGVCLTRLILKNSKK